MATITTNDIKTLRDRTCAGLMDCKQALTACDGNIEQAVDWLRKKGLALAAKKTGRTTAEGMVAVSVNQNLGVLLEVNSETDFVARNEMFQTFVKNVSLIAEKKQTTVESLKGEPYPGTDHSVVDELTNLIAVLGEHLTLRRVSYVAVDSGVVCSYVHNKVSPDTPNMGKLGVLVGLDSTGPRDRLLSLGKQIAMHIAATNPYSVSIEQLDPTILEREKAIVAEQAKLLKRPVEFLDKIVEGRVKKFYEESVLLEQIFAMNNDAIRVRDLLNAESKSMDARVTVTKFEKFVLGEGIEKQNVDFAAEVAAQLK